MTGHGWVTPLPSGAKARCGGPPMCLVCVMENEGVKITPAVEQLVQQRSKLMRDLQQADPLIQAARAVRSAVHGENRTAVHRLLLTHDALEPVDEAIHDLCKALYEIIGNDD